MAWPDDPAVGGNSFKCATSHSQVGKLYRLLKRPQLKQTLSLYDLQLQKDNQDSCSFAGGGNERGRDNLPNDQSFGSLDV